MSTDYVGAPSAAGDFILRDVTVVDVIDGSHSSGQDIRIADGTFIAPDEVDRWRKTTAKFARLPEETRQALKAHWPAQLRLAKTLSDAGVPMLAGTDANGAGWVIPGFALHDEFDLLASAGLSPLKILQAATSAAAQFFGLASVAGRAAVGYRADLVLLGSDPLADHRALHDISAVVRAGNIWSRSDLDAVLTRVEANPTTR